MPHAHDHDTDATDRTEEGIEDENLTTVVILANRRRAQAERRNVPYQPRATADQLIDAAVRRWRTNWMPRSEGSEGRSCPN